MKGCIGTVGDIRKSNFLNALSISVVSFDFTFIAFKKYLPAYPAEGTKPPKIILRITSGPSFFLALEIYELNSNPSESKS